MTEEPQDDTPATYRQIRALWRANEGLWSALSKQADQMDDLRSEIAQEAQDRINEDTVTRADFTPVREAVKRHDDEIGDLAGEVMRKASVVADLQVRLQALTEKVGELDEALAASQSNAEATNRGSGSPTTSEGYETLNERLRALWDVVNQEITDRKTHTEKALSLAKITREDFAEAEELTDNRIVQTNRRITEINEAVRTKLAQLATRVQKLEGAEETSSKEPPHGAVIIIRDIAYQRSRAEGDKGWRSTASSRVYSWDEIKDEPYKVVWTP